MFGALFPWGAMSDLIYSRLPEKPLVWKSERVQSPPFSRQARTEAGQLLRRLQRGERLAMPHSRPMPAIGRRCHELRIQDRGRFWRIVYRIDRDAILVLSVFAKQTSKTPRNIVESCRKRLADYDHEKP